MAEDYAEAFSELSAAIGPLTRSELLEIGHLGTTIVVARTKQGIDAGGKTFTAYNETYAHERERKSLRTSPPDLARTGHMLGAMQPYVTGDNEVTISFSSELEAKKAATNNDGSKRRVAAHSRKGNGYERQTNTPAREFLDVRLPRELEVVGDAISEIIMRRRGR